jgi:hypothetical protein
MHQYNFLPRLATKIYCSLDLCSLPLEPEYIAAEPMKLNQGLQLAYCTNVHRGETWAETFASLSSCTLAVRQRVCPDAPYAIGLRLSGRAARELSDPATLRLFQLWLAKNHCYVFTINGFPFGQFHGTCVKERVYLPDWTSRERLDYTNCLFDLLAQLLPADLEGSVSTVPCGFKELVTTAEEMQIIRAQLWRCVEHIARVSAQTGRRLHLGLEPEPLCLLETSGEVIHFFDRMRAEHRNDPRLAEHLGVNYDTCHLAVEFEEPQNVIACFDQHGIKISKLHLSSALKVRPTAEARAALAAFADRVYLHQVVVRQGDGKCVIYRDLDDALIGEPMEPGTEGNEEVSTLSEWRIHFHVPLHSPPTPLFDNTADHLLGVLDILQARPGLCSHLEMETYTWEVLPPELKDRDVVSQLVAEYEWTLARLAERGLYQKG